MPDEEEQAEQDMSKFSMYVSLTFNRERQMDRSRNKPVRSSFALMHSLYYYL